MSDSHTILPKHVSLGESLSPLVVNGSPQGVVEKGNVHPLPSQLLEREELEIDYNRKRRNLP